MPTTDTSPHPGLPQFRNAQQCTRGVQVLRHFRQHRPSVLVPAHHFSNIPPGASVHSKTHANDALPILLESILYGHNIRNSHGHHRNQGSSGQCRTRQAGNGCHRRRGSKHRPLRFASTVRLEPSSSYRLSARFSVHASNGSARKRKIRCATRIIIDALPGFQSSRLMNGRPDAWISAATAHHVRHRIVDILVAWLGFLP